MINNIVISLRIFEQRFAMPTFDNRDALLYELSYSFPRDVKLLRDHIQTLRRSLQTVVQADNSLFTRRDGV